MKLGIDVNRHKEIIVKAISGLLLLLLKHLKLNHIYQVKKIRTKPFLLFKIQDTSTSTACFAAKF